MLTDLERELLALFAEGHTIGSAARATRASRTKVKDHAGRARRKLGARTRPHAIAEALRRGVIT